MKVFIYIFFIVSTLGVADRIYSLYDWLYGVSVDAFESGLIDGAVGEIKQAITQYKKENGKIPSGLGQMHQRFIKNSYQVLPSRLRGRLGVAGVDLEKNFSLIDLMGVWRIINIDESSYMLIGDWRLLGMNNIPVCTIKGDVMELLYLDMHKIIEMGLVLDAATERSSENGNLQR